jgi:hypothetical protein
MASVLGRVLPVSSDIVPADHKVMSERCDALPDEDQSVFAGDQVHPGGWRAVYG